MHVKLIAALTAALALTGALVATGHRGHAGGQPADTRQYLLALTDACFVERVNIDIGLQPDAVFENRQAVADTAGRVAGRLDQFVAAITHATPPSSLAEWHRRALAYVREDAAVIHTIATRLLHARTPAAFDESVDAGAEAEQRLEPSKEKARGAYERLPVALRRDLDHACPIFTFQQ